MAERAASTVLSVMTAQMRARLSGGLITEDHSSSNANTSVVRYLSPRSGSTATTRLPSPISWATMSAAQHTAPDEMPESMPSSLANRLAVSFASSYSTGMM